jgi:hypothetical protein
MLVRWAFQNLIPRPILTYSVVKDDARKTVVQLNRPFRLCGIFGFGEARQLRAVEMIPLRAQIV